MRLIHCLAWCSSAATLVIAPAAYADDVWIGVYQHDVTLAQVRFETGQDIKLGWIGETLDGLKSIGRPAPHVLVSKSLSGQTDYVAVGLNWTLGSKFYARPGIGLALNNGPRRAIRDGQRVDLGSPITFEPELAVGWRIDARYRVEASWIHLSHATIFSGQNRGMDSMGVRLLVHFP
ncbi:acyloxyacyl hydrolase [Novosphingobium sp. RD2P27]|uniref:Acyloxyacyl hydrolase n=1 Tax=Novosphingobium kalidii TaxID=3230299 RepID=A0ABV2D1R6_9SPHN